MENRRSGIRIMIGLTGMIKPLLGIMALAVLMGCAGNLAATFITVMGGYGILEILGVYKGMPLSLIFTLMIIFAVCRGILRYAEQAGNHYIAFKLLARIRHKVFAVLRQLAPAKLDGEGKGNLISMITSDIELLEVFYAHTISPVMIAVLTSLFMMLFMGRLHPAAGITAGIFYLIVGAVIPVYNGKRGGEDGMKYRTAFGSLNTEFLDNLYGLREIIQFGQQEKRLNEMDMRTGELEDISSGLKKKEAGQKIATDWAILASGVVMTLLCGTLAGKGQLEGYEAVIAVIAMMSSFGPVAALSALSNNLHHTLASGNRILNLLSEEPAVKENETGKSQCGSEILCRDVSFRYPDDDRKNNVLEDFRHEFKEGKIHGIHGKSGCGKSTLLKLMMRFYETDSGSICYGKENVNVLQTSTLRSQVSYVEQETFLFHDTIENNIKVANPDASRAEVIEAAKKASVHEFIESLTDGYDTKVAELGSSLSGGERQRIGIARAFLHGGKVMFLDEPTSNIDSLNEGIILKSLEKEKDGRTMILVSHRKSTMGIADTVLQM